MNVSASARKRDRSPGQTLIVGVGNPLLGDEGIGCHVIERLSQMAMAADVSIVDCGCDLLNLASYIDEARRIIVIDAIRAGGKPGQIYRFDFDELDEMQTLGPGTESSSVHQLRIVDALRLLKQAYRSLTCCKITIIGIEPGALGLSTELSEQVDENIADLMRLLLEEVSFAYCEVNHGKCQNNGH
jgi:hydrogenase maturation protease